jgi:hypothetical protein
VTASLGTATSAAVGGDPLIDVLKETVLRTGCLQAVTSVAGTGTLTPHILAERLILAIYAYGTNTGIRSVISAAHGHGEEAVRMEPAKFVGGGKIPNYHLPGG